MRGENEFDPQQNSEAVFSNRTVRFAACVGSVSLRALTFPINSYDILCHLNTSVRRNR